MSVVAEPASANTLLASYGAEGGYTDGYLYSIIRYGRGLMPKYGDKLPDQADRWAIVNHVRGLQAAAPAQAATGGQN